MTSVATYLPTPPAYTYQSISANQIIVEAFQKLGIQPAVITNNDLVIALSSLNFILQSWTNRGVRIWKLKSGMITLVPGQISYSLPQTINQTPNTYSSSSSESTLTNIPVPILQGQTIPYILDFYDMSVRYGQNIQNTVTLNNNTSLNVSLTNPPAWPQIIGVYSPSDSIYQLTVYALLPTATTIYQDMTPQTYIHLNPYNFTSSPTSTPVSTLTITTSSESFLDGTQVVLKNGSTTVPCTTIFNSSTTLTANLTAGISPLTTFSFSFPESAIYQDVIAKSYVSGTPYNFQPSPTSTSVGSLTIMTSSGIFPSGTVVGLSNGGTTVPCTTTLSSNTLTANLMAGSSQLTSFSVSSPGIIIYQDETSQLYISGTPYNFSPSPTSNPVSSFTMTTSIGTFSDGTQVVLKNGGETISCSTSMTSPTSLTTNLTAGISSLTSFSFTFSDIAIYQDVTAKSYISGTPYNFDPFPGTPISTLIITTSEGTFPNDIIVGLNNGDDSVPCTTTLSSNTLTVDVTSGSSLLTSFNFTLFAINIYHDTTPQAYTSGNPYNFSPSPTSTAVSNLSITTSTGTFPTGTTVGLVYNGTTVPSTTTLSSNTLTANITSGFSPLTSFSLSFPGTIIYQDETSQTYTPNAPYNFSPSPTSTSVGSIMIVTSTGSFFDGTQVVLKNGSTTVPCTTIFNSSTTLTANLTAGISPLTTFSFSLPDLIIYQDPTQQFYSSNIQHYFDGVTSTSTLTITTSEQSFPDGTTVSLYDNDSGPVSCTTNMTSDTSLTVNLTSGFSAVASFSFSFPNITIYQDRGLVSYESGDQHNFESIVTTTIAVENLTITTSTGTFPTGTTVSLYDNDRFIPCTTSLSSNTLTANITSGFSPLTTFSFSFPAITIYQDSTPQTYTSGTSYNFSPSPTSTSVGSLRITTSTGTFPDGTLVSLFYYSEAISCSTSVLSNTLTVNLTAGISSLTDFSFSLPDLIIYQDTSPQTYTPNAPYNFSPSPTSNPISTLTIVTSTGTFPSGTVVDLSNSGGIVPCTTNMTSDTSLTVNLTSGSSILTKFFFILPQITIYQDTTPQVYTSGTPYNFQPSPTSTSVGSLEITTSTGSFTNGIVVSLNDGGTNVPCTTTFSSPTTLFVNLTAEISPLTTFSFSSFPAVTIYQDESPKLYIVNNSYNFSPSPTSNPISSLTITTSTGTFPPSTQVVLKDGGTTVPCIISTSPMSLTVTVMSGSSLLTSFEFQMNNVTIYQDSSPQAYTSGTSYNFSPSPTSTSVGSLRITTSTGSFTNGIVVSLNDGGTNVPCTTIFSSPTTLFVNLTTSPGYSPLTTFSFTGLSAGTYEITIIGTPAETYELTITTPPPPTETYELTITIPPPIPTYELTITTPPVSTYELTITTPPIPTYDLTITAPPLEAYDLTIIVLPLSTYELTITTPPLETYDLTISALPVPTYQLAITAPPIPTYELTITTPPVSTYQLAITAPPIPTYDLTITAPLVATVYQDFAPQYYGSPGLFFELSTQYQQVSSLIFNTNSSYPFTQTPIVKLLTNVVDNKMTRIGYDDWQNISNKMSQGTPTSYYVDRQINPIWYPWMVPTSRTPSNYFAFKYLGYQAFQDITNLATIPDIVPRFYLAVIYQLAVDLALKRTMTDLIQILGAQAQQEFILASKEDSDKSSFSIDMDYSRNTR